MTNWEKKMEEEWGHPFVHESGHALMAVLQGIPCHGIFYEKSEDGGKFCTLVPPIPSGEQTNSYFLFLAAGAAAEKLIYNAFDQYAARADREGFEVHDSPGFDEIMQESLDLLTSKKRQLKRLISMLKSKVRQVDFDLGRLPEIGMEGSVSRYSILISKDELEESARRP